MSLMALSDLLDVVSVLVLDPEVATFNVLLGIVPSATRVGGGEGNLDARDDAAGEETTGGLVAEESTGEERGSDDEDAWGDHLLKGGLGGDANAFLVVGAQTLVNSLFLLALDFSNHLLSSITDGGHGHGREPVREHGTNKETSESERLEDVHVVNKFIVEGLSNSGDEGTEESEGDEAGRSDGETLTNGSSGVSCSIELIGVSTDILVEVGHLSNTASVVRDWAIAVDSEGNWEAAEHANGSKSNTVHGSPVEGEENSEGQAENGNDIGQVTEGESLDDVG